MKKLDELRHKGSNLYVSGRIQEALKVYLQLTANTHYPKKTSHKDKLNDLHGMVAMYNYLGDYNSALNTAKRIYSLNPDDYSALYTLSANYLFAKQPDKTIEIALQAETIKSDDLALYDVFAEAYMLLGELGKASAAGTRSIDLKDQATQNKRVYEIPEPAISPFNTQNKSKNVIAFTLFGDNPRYCETAVINSLLAPDLYPFWSCRFYHDKHVPLHVLDRLQKNGAQLILKQESDDIKDKLFWRFLVMSDHSIDRYIVRDCDSVINTKESMAVNEWIKTGQRFHIMRDFYTHTELILAGMFGGTTDVFTDIELMIKEFKTLVHENRMHLDQLFLRNCIWPTIKNHALIHDHCFNNKHSKPFPASAVLPDNKHIGQNEATLDINVNLANGKDGDRVKWSMFDQEHNIICSYFSTLQKGAWHSQIPMSYVEGLQNKTYYIKSELVKK